MENWRVAIISVASTLGIIIIILFLIAIIQTGAIEVVKEELIDDYCSSIPLTEARDLEVCNE
jgi:hypothetical protein